MSRSDVAIRQATVDDAADIATVHVETWRVSYRGLVPQSLLDGLSVEARTTVWRTILTEDEGSVLVAVDQPSRHHIVGFISVGASRDTDSNRALSEVYAIYLHPDYWGRGAGRQLLDRGLAEVPTATAVTLWVLESNDRSRRFYERQGWAADGATKDDHRGEVVLSELRYRRLLPSL
jgi:ribosomal protein S18 acetylase RimI-like enzyme